MFLWSSSHRALERFPIWRPAAASHVGQDDRSRLRINAARFRASLVQLRPASRRALKARRLIRRLNGPGPLCPTRPQSRGPQAKGNCHEQRTLRYSPAHHRQDRERDRVRRRRVPAALASFRRQHHAARQHRVEEAVSRRQRPDPVGRRRREGLRLRRLGHLQQWAEAGAQVRKGEKSAYIVFYKELEFAAETETGDADTVTRLLLSNRFQSRPHFAANTDPWLGENLVG